MTTPLRASPRSAQRGVATLFMTLMLLLIAGLVLLYTSRGAVMEQRLSANEIRSKQAFAAANAGLDNALAYMQATGGVDHDGNSVPDTVTSATNWAGSTAPTYYSFRFCQPAAAATCPAAHTGAALPTCTPATAPTDFKDVLVASCGWSDDDTAVHLVTQRIGGTPSLPGTIPVPLISRGVAGLTTGSASVFNYFNDLTVWSGDALTSVSNNAKTFVRDTVNFPIASNTTNTDGDTKPDYRDLDGGTANCAAVTGYTCSTRGGTLGHDTVTGDTQLSATTNDGFFQLFFGDSPTNYQPSVATQIDASDSSQVNSLNGMKDQSIWVTGDLSVPAGSTIGSPDHPVILIVDGDMNLQSNFQIYGVVYVRGDITGSGGPDIYGAMITEGMVNINGNPNIVYDPYSGTSLNHNGIATKLQGSWKDW